MEDYKKLILQRPCQSIFLIALALFMALQYKPAVLNYTTRFVDFADYMLQHGMTLFPIADDLQPYPDYTIATRCWSIWRRCPSASCPYCRWACPSASLRR